jgi:hypothetical protein
MGFSKSSQVRSAIISTLTPVSVVEEVVPVVVEVEVAVPCLRPAGW